MHDFMATGAAIPRSGAMISIPVVMFIPSEFQHTISGPSLNKQGKDNSIYVFFRGNFIL